MAHRNNLLPCFVCDVRLIPRVMARIGGENNLVRQEIAIARRENAGRQIQLIDNETRLCNNCNIGILREIQILEENPQSLRLNVITQTAHQTCLICNAREEIHRLSLECRIDIFVKRNIYVPENNRCCNHHFNEKGLLLDLLLDGLRFVNRPYIIEGQQLQIFLQGLREKIISGNRRSYNDETDFTDEEFTYLSSMTKEQFNDLFTYCDPIPVQGGHRRVSKKDLLCFITKLRQGLSDDFLKIIFHYNTRQATSLAIATVRQSLMQRFTVENIGFRSITRQQYIDRHVNNFSNRLYNPRPLERKVIVYIDCTYLDIEKRALRLSYCLHKGKHLVKPPVLLAPDGYILDVHGPYFSNAGNNDAIICIHEFEHEVEEMQEWFQEGDIAVLDRGYRDAIEYLRRLGFNVIMPPLLQQGQNQFTTLEANQARLVTCTRWVMEMRIGHFKSIFKFFTYVIKTAHTAHLRDFLLIAGAIINRYRGLVVRQYADEALANRMLERLHDVNVVQARVDQENLTRRRGRWVPLTPQHVPLFPRLTLDFIRAFTYGTYQLRLAPSYIQDSLLRAPIEIEEGDQLMEIDLNTAEPGFIRLRVFSRFRNATRYQTWIAFNEENRLDDDENDNELILGHYCTCKAGARTLGTCAHVASVLWYLGYGRHEEDVRYPSTILLEHILNAQNAHNHQ